VLGHWHPKPRVITLKNRESQQALVAHAGNPSYSAARDQEDCGLKPTQANGTCRPYLEKPHDKKKRAGGVAQGVGPEFKPQYHKKKKKKKERKKICSSLAAL
jgi:hypothetical protein